MSQGSNCFETTTFSLETIDAQSKITDKCEYPVRTVQSDQVFVNYENGTIGADGNMNALVQDRIDLLYHKVPQSFRSNW